MRCCSDDVFDLTAAPPLTIASESSLIVRRQTITAMQLGYLDLYR